MNSQHSHSKQGVILTTFKFVAVIFVIVTTGKLAPLKALMSDFTFNMEAMDKNTHWDA